MEDNIYIFQVTVCKFGNEEILETFEVLSFNIFQATHLAVDWVFGNDSKFKIPVEISQIKRLQTVNNIINPDFIRDMEDNDENNYDGSIPLKVARNLTDDETFTFDCGECKESLRVPSDMLFPYVTCPNCDFKMERGDIHNAGGIYYYAKSEKDDKK